VIMISHTVKFPTIHPQVQKGCMKIKVARPRTKVSRRFGWRANMGFSWLVDRID
jgi:hypothetical protein